MGKKRPVRRSRSTLASKVRNLSAYKHNTQDDTTLTRTMTHNTLYTFVPTENIAQGDTNADRDGDQVHLTAFKLTGWFTTPATTSAVLYRLIICWCGEEFAGANVSFTTTGIASQVFLLNSGSTFLATAQTNPKAITVLYDQLIDINSEIAATNTIRSFDTKVELNTRFPYQSTASGFGKFKNLTVFIVASIFGGTTGVTAAGSVLANGDLIFQDT